MALHPVFTLMPTCKCLKLFPTELKMAFVASRLWEIKEEDDNTPEEVQQYFREILGLNEPYPGMSFKAECTKHNICCVLTESVVISEYTPLSVLVANKQRMLDCSDREEIREFPNKALMSWVLESLEIQ
jgi:hypothetical protein